MSTLKVDTIQHSGGTTGLTINSDGRVLQPNLPAWRISLASDASVSSDTGWQVIAWDETNVSGENLYLQGGCTVVSSKIVVPVSGIYMFGVNLRIDGIANGNYLTCQIERNDGETGNENEAFTEQNVGATYAHIGISAVMNFNASDTLRVRVASPDGTYTIQDHCTFYGALIG